MNQVTASTTASDTNPETTAIATTAVSPLADVAISKAALRRWTPGTDLTYTIAVRNDGPSNAAGVVVADPTPTGLTFISNTGACVTAFPCALGTILVGETRVIVTKMSVSPGYAGSGPIVNTASVTATTPDPTTINNTATTTTTVGAPRADVAITKGSQAKVARNASLGYVLVVTNLGPSDATGVVVSDPTPAGLTFVSNSGDCTTAFPAAWESFAGQSPHQYDEHDRPREVMPGQTRFMNAATVTSATPPGSDQQHGDHHPAIGTPGGTNVAIAKVRDRHVQPGSNVTYVITVSNTGASRVNAWSSRIRRRPARS